jgi:phage repressor protein C with HTH and peptisase S24 domain
MTGLIDRIHRRLAATGKTARGASLEAGLSDAFIRNILTGKSRSPSADNLGKLARTLQTTEAWLLRGEGPESAPPEAQDNTASMSTGVMPLLSAGPTTRLLARIAGDFPRGGAGERMEQVLGSDVWSLPAAYLRHELQAPSGNLFITSVIGDAMLPTLLPGDRVIVDRSQIQPADGIFLVAAGDEFAVKRLELVNGSLPLRIRIKSDNPVHGMDEIPATHLKVIGRAVGRITRL